ncbi:HCN4 [Symbiodinium sp. CCMP2592]|nr:HCN4 [Symbiodinium sp. CCMP2592]
MPRKTIIFVRHGESEYNKAMRETGEDPLLRDAKLTERGRAQAAAARPQLQELFEEIGSAAGWLLLSSPLRRALDTAAGIWPEAFQAGEGTFEIWPELREVVTGCDDLGSTPSSSNLPSPTWKPSLAVCPRCGGPSRRLTRMCLWTEMTCGMRTRRTLMHLRLRTKLSLLAVWRSYWRS